MLEWTDAKTKTIHKLEPSGETPLETAKGTKMRYYFTPQEEVAAAADRRRRHAALPHAKPRGGVHGAVCVSGFAAAVI